MQVVIGRDLRLRGELVEAAIEPGNDDDTVSGPCDYMVYEEGNHVCFNISYKLRPLTADWMKERLGAA